jgi:voltage-gated potassium channel
VRTLNIYSHNKPDSKWRAKIYSVIFEAHTRIGKVFDIGLILAIILSVIVVMLDSIPALREDYQELFYQLEWVFTIIFTIEYITRIIAVKKPRLYIFSFYGMVDLLATIPTYISLIIPGTQVLLVIRMLRILRVFRILKLVQYLSEAEFLRQALYSSRRKISVFLFTVLNLVIVAGSIMYVVEGAENGFTSIPRSIYWAVVTLTTVGFGDITPGTNLGQFIAAIIMITGYGIIAVPTGIVSYEMALANRKRMCTQCGEVNLPAAAHYCSNCGVKLDKAEG